jgi:hypothetical protein
VGLVIAALGAEKAVRKIGAPCPAATFAAK